MNKIMISIVIPVYNAAAYLPAAINMLARQSAGGFEAIFVNDGSTDESLRILRDAEAAADFSMRVIDRINGGASAARNTGIDAARGEYVTFMDADDAIAADYVECLAANAAPGGVAVFRHSRVVGGAPAFDECDGAVKRVDAEAALREFMLNPTRFGVYDLLIDREFLAESGTRFPEGYPYYEDYDFILRLFNACDEVVMLNECKYCYLAAPGSAMNIFNEKRLQCLQLFDNIHSLYLEKRTRFHREFLKWFSARIRWSVLWQACVSMPVRHALSFGGGRATRRAMRNLADYPDRRVALSALIYLICPPAFAIIMRKIGKRRTLLPEDKRI